MKFGEKPKPLICNPDGVEHKINMQSSNKKRICFIVNPVAGSDLGKYFRKIRNIKEKFIDKFLDITAFDYDLFFTEEKGHASRLCEDALKKGYDIIAAVGGDGTVNEVGRVLLGKDTALAIIPAGSGNGLSRHLGIPMNIRGSLAVINSQNEIKIDTARINLTEPTGAVGSSTVFISTAGLGFEAFMAKKFAGLEKRGFWQYIKATAKEFFSYELQNYELNIDGVDKKARAFMLTFANSSQYGNNAIISPTAKLDDGLLDVCIVNKFPFYAVPALLFRLFAGTIDKSPYIEIIKAKKTVVKRESDYVQVDGDFLRIEKSLEIEVNPMSLRVLAP